MTLPDNEEKRRYQREQAAFAITYKIKAPLSARNEFGVTEHDGIASNLSEEGLSLFTNFELPVGALLIVQFRLISNVGETAEDRSRKMELEAEVRHCEKALVRASYIVGLHFNRLSDANRAYIARAVMG